jgi:acyl-CoA thioester hydrolase
MILKGNAMPTTTKLNIRVRSTDIDADGIVNNSIYFQYFEQVRLEHLAILRFDQSDSNPDDGKFSRSFTIAETRCAFRLPLRYGDRITACCWTSEVRNRSFSFAYEILIRDEPDAFVAEGSSAQVWLDADGKATPLPRLLKASLEQSAASPPLK